MMSIRWDHRHMGADRCDDYWVACIRSRHYYIERIPRFKLPFGRLRRGRNDWRLVIAGEMDAIATGPVWYLKENAVRHANQLEATKALEAIG